VGFAYINYRFIERQSKGTNLKKSAQSKQIRIKVTGQSLFQVTRFRLDAVSEAREARRMKGITVGLMTVDMFFNLCYAEYA